MEVIHTQKKRKKILYRVLTVFFICLLLFFCLVYYGSLLFEKATGYTGSIERAKELGVFLNAYGSDKQILILEDGSMIDIGDIWTERRFQNGRMFRGAIIDSISGRYNLCVSVNASEDSISTGIFSKYVECVLVGDSLILPHKKVSGDDVWLNFGLSGVTKDTIFFFIIESDLVRDRRMKPELAQTFERVKITFTRISGKKRYETSD